MCLSLIYNRIMDYNKRKLEPIDSLNYSPKVNPAWAELLYKGVGKRKKLKESFNMLKNNPELAIQGLLGKSLLDKQIQPFVDKIMPEKTKLDIAKGNLMYSPNENLDLSIDKDATFNLNFRF